MDDVREWRVVPTQTVSPKRVRLSVFTCDMKVRDFHAQTFFAHVGGTLKRLFDEYGLDEASFGSVQKENLAEALALAILMEVHPSWSHEDFLAAVDRRNYADLPEFSSFLSYLSTLRKATNRKHGSNGSRAKG